MKSKSNFKVLIVDDDPVLLRVTEHWLKETAYHVSTATCGQDCLNAVRHEKPDLLLLDVILPDINGMEICKIIRADPVLKSIYIVLLSGKHIASESISEGLETGADGYLIKPLKNRELLAWVHSAFRTIQAEHALQETEVRLQSLFDFSPISIWEEDFSMVKNYFNQLRNEGVDDFREYFANNPHKVLEVASLVKIIEINQTSVKFFGADNKEDIPKYLPGYFNADSSEVFREELIALSEGQTHFECEIPIETPKGDKKDLLLNLSVVPGYEDTLAKVIISFMNITERKQAEQGLRKSESRYKQISNQLEAIFDHVPGLLFYKDKKNNFIRVNQHVANAQGKSKEELEGRNLSEIYPKEVAEKYYEDDLCVINSGVAKLNIEEPWQTSEGFKWVNTSKIPFVDADGEIIGIIGMSMDITERKLADAEIKRKNEELLKIVAEKDKFFSIIAHDLRSPFQSLLGFTRLMVEELPSLRLDEIQKMAWSMRTSANKLFNLLENLLEWSLMQRGLGNFNPESLLLINRIELAIELVRDAASKKMIGISYDIPKDLMVMADAQMLESIFRNLLQNAVKFTPRGGKITIATKPVPGNSIEISISDTGIGMNKDLMDKLFRLDEHTSRNGTDGEPSTGLGLILCKDFVTKNGGSLWVESEEGKGSVFFFTIPREN